MFQVSVENRSKDTVQMKFAGTLDERVNLAGILDESALVANEIRHLRLDCAGITRINSQGLRQWVRCFERLRARGIALRFTSCSPELVDHINFISSVCRPGEIESLQVPFYCRSCRNETRPVFQLIPPSASIPTSMPCPHCAAGRQELDHRPDDYFKFATRQPRAATDTSERTGTRTRMLSAA